MEFKYNLKKLRTEKGLTQAQLAEKLFVSRSTVVKWENGLGLPSPESMAALEELFEVTAADMATKEPENVIVQKNRRMHCATSVNILDEEYELRDGFFLTTQEPVSFFQIGDSLYNVIGQ